MMILRSSPTSSFARKVRIAASVLGLINGIEVRETDLNDAANPIRRQNPLGKIPALILDDGSFWYDSRVILEMLDHMAGGGRIVPREPGARFAALRLLALCDGVLDASVLIVYESRYRPAEMRVHAWLDRQADKIERALDVLEAAPPPLTAPPDVGQIALACALGYGDLRFAGSWRAKRPRLVAWLDAFAAQVPAFAATKIETWQNPGACAPGFAIGSGTPLRSDN
jgi:glutathione S-transferase